MYSHLIYMNNMINVDVISFSNKEPNISGNKNRYNTKNSMKRIYSCKQ